MSVPKSLDRYYSLLMQRAYLDEEIATFDKESIGQMLRQLRKDRGITLRGMAQRLEVSASFLHDLEHGRRRLNLPHLKAILSVCGAE